MHTEEIHILVIFSCETGAVEQLALAAAVGAVQARAGIRLRRVVEPGIASDEITDRMDRDYVAPRPADTEWADGVVLAVRGQFIAQIQSLAGLGGKPVASLEDADPSDTAVQRAGISADTVAVDRARQLGRRLVETIRASRGSI